MLKKLELKLTEACGLKKTHSHAAKTRLMALSTVITLTAGKQTNTHILQISGQTLPLWLENRHSLATKIKSMELSTVTALTADKRTLTVCKDQAHSTQCHHSSLHSWLPNRHSQSTKIRPMALSTFPMLTRRYSLAA